MDAAFALRVPHLSMYGLIVEEKTPFWARRERGKLPLPTEDAEATMFARAIEAATGAGYAHYEVSNYALPGYECRHNQIYWRNEEYFGFGAGAVGYRGGVRATNVRLPTRYIETVCATGDAFEDEERLNPEANDGRDDDGRPAPASRCGFGAGSPPASASAPRWFLPTRSSDTQAWACWRPATAFSG